MKNVKEIAGVLSIVQRLKGSEVGNPRFLVSVGSHGQFKTVVDASLGYSVQNHDRELVSAQVGEHYGAPHITRVRTFEFKNEVAHAIKHTGE
jgi:hypothetical protein